MPETCWALHDRVTVGGDTLAVDVLGADRPGTPVVLTHGTPSWSYLWRRVAPRLAEDRPVHLWDLPSYGDSTGVAPSVAGHARALAALIAAHLRTTTHGALPGPLEDAYLARYAGPAGQQRYLDQVAGFSADDTRDVVARLGEIGVPTDVLWGEHDTWLAPTDAAMVRDAVPGARLTMVAGAGHFLTEDAPDDVLAALIGVLDR